MLSFTNLAYHFDYDWYYARAGVSQTPVLLVHRPIELFNSITSYVETIEILKL